MVCVICSTPDYRGCVKAMAMSPTPVLSVRNLRVSLPTIKGNLEALRGIHFDMQRGEKLGLIGESGCGKSLTALAIMGLLPERAQVQGSVQFKGTELTSMSDVQLCHIRGASMAMIFQEPMTALNPLQPIWQQIAEPMQLHLGLSNTAAKARALESLERVQLTRARERLGAYPHELSGGQRQRVMIAMALVCKPDVLIADEPTTALDINMQQEVLSLITQLASEEGMGLLLVSHNLGLVRQHVDRVMVMYGGTVVESAPTQTLFQNRLHPYTQGLFAARPLLGLQRGTRLQTIPGQVPDLFNWPAGCAFNDRCPHADSNCAASMPRLEVTKPEHWVRCHHWQGMEANT